MKHFYTLLRHTLLSILLYSSVTLAAPATEDNIAQFVNAIAIIKTHYALPISDKKILEDGIRGMVGNLDPHSEYLDEEAYKILLTDTNGKFGGIGIELTSEYGVLKVISPLDNTPAAKAGIKAGDYIVALNGKSVNDLSSDAAIHEMRGDKGTIIALTIIRKGEKNPLRFSLKRDIIRIDTLKSNLLDDSYGYIRISQFQEATASLLAEALKNLKQEAHGHLKGLILDLRNNPGGLLQTAVQVTDMFLDSDKITHYHKLIVYTEGRDPTAQYKAYAASHDFLEGAPLMILINDGSASASEIVTGALQDYHRAVVVGTPSFGKGSVQTILPLDSDHAIKLTTALYYTPAGRLIQNRGITPDILIPDMKTTATESDTQSIGRENDLKGHLKNMTTTTAEKPSSQTLSPLALKDFQLYETLNMLKTLTLTKAS